MPLRGDEERLLELIDEAERKGRELEPLLDADTMPFHRYGITAAVRDLGWTRERVHDGTFRGWHAGVGLGLSRPLYELSKWPPGVESRVDDFIEAVVDVERFWNQHQHTLVGG